MTADLMRRVAFRLHLRRTPPDEAGRRLREALDMHTAGVALHRHKLAQRHPEATSAELDEMVGRWLAEPQREARLHRPLRKGEGHDPGR